MRHALAIPVALCLVAPVLPPSRSADTSEKASVALPLTIEKTWYRTGGKRREGDLTVSRDGLEFVTRKRVLSVPLERIQFVSLGRMKQDVDTEWVLLSVGVSRPWDVVGLRDGKKWGFGGRTEEIYKRLRRAMRELGAAQFRVALGYQAYEDADRGCAFAIPATWSTYVESLVLAQQRAPGGTTVFSAEEIREVVKTSEGGTRAEDDLELLDAIVAGEKPGFFLEREPAGRGMKCLGFSPKARERVLASAREDLVFGEEYETLQPPEATSHPVGGCEGLRILGRSRRPDGAEVVLEMYAAANGDRLYYLFMRALADRYEEARKPLANALETVRFAAEVRR